MSSQAAAIGGVTRVTLVVHGTGIGTTHVAKTNAAIPADMTIIIMANADEATAATKIRIATAAHNPLGVGTSRTITAIPRLIGCTNNPCGDECGNSFYPFAPSIVGSRINKKNTTKTSTIC